MRWFEWELCPPKAQALEGWSLVGGAVWGRFRRSSLAGVNATGGGGGFEVL